MMKREQPRLFANIDWILVGIYFALVLIGWMNIYASGLNDAHPLIYDTTQRYGKQMLWILAAFAIALMILLIDSKLFTTFAYPIYVVGILVLIFTIFAGTEVSGSKSWLSLGSFRIQPAEFTKITTALVLAKYMSTLNINVKELHNKIIPIILMVLPAVIIRLQKETGSALVYGGFLLVLYREGLSGNYLLLGIGVVLLFILTLLFGKFIMITILFIIALALFLLIQKRRKNIISLIGLFLLTSIFAFSVDYSFEHFLEAHQKTRINVLLGKETDPKGAEYNVDQSKIAIGSGGFFGKGFLNGTQTKYKFVPAQDTDFIFCTVGEEWGFLGSSVLIGLYILLLTRIVRVAERQRSPFARIYGYGVASVFFMNFAINIAMTIGLAPVIGIPLPFLSYGGSSLWAFTILLFIFIKQDSNRLLLI
ncbi:MAG: rod shape-determining protein RodA [Bacteroidota bacterium]|nr:rod shape-determining protein RodA [Bacteroidota bacterium]